MGQVGNAIGPTLPLVACCGVFFGDFFSDSLVRREVAVNFIAATPSIELTGASFWH
jgi:hypothetical protein